MPYSRVRSIRTQGITNLFYLIFIIFKSSIQASKNFKRRFSINSLLQVYLAFYIQSAKMSSTKPTKFVDQPSRFVVFVSPYIYIVFFYPVPQASLVDAQNTCCPDLYTTCFPQGLTDQSFFYLL